MKYVIGIDCGTTNVKAVVYDEKGREIVKRSRSNDVISNGVCNEQDMEVLFQNVLSTLKALVNENSFLRKETAALAVSGQGEGLWPLDGKGRPTRNAILWNDGRVYRLMEKIKGDNDLYVSIKKTVASYIKNGSTLTLIKWFKENERECYDRTRTIFTCKDWIRYRLTGVIAWEYTDASCSSIDMMKKEYARDVFKTLGIEDAIEKLPGNILYAVENAGELNPKLRDELGFEKSVPVAGGMIDICSSAFGLGMTEVNDTTIILGTTGMTLTVKKEYFADVAFNGWEYSADGSSFVKGMGTMAAAPNLDWVRRILFPELTDREFYGILEGEIKGRRPGGSGVMYHPHISLSGERAPFFDSRATADFLGIRENTTKVDLVEAVLEGVVLSLRDCLGDLDEISIVNVTGGGSNSDTWMQMLSDALGKRIVVQDATELSAKGAALCGAMMTGIIKDISDKSFFSVKKEFIPDQGRHEDYQKMYGIYKSTQKSLEDFWAWRSEYLN